MVLETVGAISVKVVLSRIETRYRKHLKELGGFRSMPTHEDEVSWKHTLDLTSVWGASADLLTPLVPLPHVNCNIFENGYELCENGFQYMSPALLQVENMLLPGFDKNLSNVTRKWKHFLEPSFFPGFLLEKEKSCARYFSGVEMIGMEM